MPYVAQHIPLSSYDFFLILHLDFHAVGALLRGVYRYGTREIYYIFWESVYLRFVLGNSELRTLQTIAKGQSNDRRHGYVYTYPGSFQALAWNGFGVFAYNSVESKLLVLAIKASSKATSCGTSNDKDSRFSFCPNQSNCAISESMAVKASDPKCNSLTT